ncbi:hypothetical protein BGZ83_011613 [Gryganskiella cystojenkinii]|nr:hypothetical protein BGZ83_011613 [Gryganskiella cystojenkinii]
MDRPRISPIATTSSAHNHIHSNSYASGPTTTTIPTIKECPHSTHSCPEITTQIDRTLMAPGLPSPPLSPQQDLGSRYGKQRFRSSLQFSSTAFDHEDNYQENIADQGTDDNHCNSSPSSPLNNSKGDEPVIASFDQGVVGLEDLDDTSVPMLPSQLRKRHESIKLISKAQQLQKQKEQQEKQEREQAQESTLASPRISFQLSEVSSEPTPLSQEDDEEDEIESIRAPYHTQGALIRAKSYSMFESRGHQAHHQHQPDSTSLLSPSQRLLATQGMFSPTSTSMQAPMRSSEMPTRDWVKMQSKIQALEMEVSHVSRTNLLLNQELDKVNAHLARVTASDDEDNNGGGESSWRREYEFLVQQVDLMHRQLQIAHSEQHARATQMMVMEVGTSTVVVPGQQAEMTRQLYAEVKDLTASLRLWQSAFQQAEQKYRQKCDGERALKQTLRERETQLSSLVDKLSGYETEFRKSISNYEEWVRLNSELQAFERTSSSSGRSTSPSLLGRRLSIEDCSSPNKDITTEECLAKDVSNDESELIGMPGTFPGHHRAHVDKELLGEQQASVDQLSVSILSWAALLATYMLS